MNNLKFSILIPTYNGEKTIAQTLSSILKQSFCNFEIIIQDDASSDNTKKIIENFNDERIKIYRNRNNLGYPLNIEIGRKYATGDILYLMGQDDILAKNALLNTYNAFISSDKIGAVTRPYFWFDKDIQTPVRAKKQLNPNKDEVVTMNDSYERIITTYATLDQLSGLALRIKYIDTQFHPDIFPCHVYPIASIMKKYPIVFLKDYTIAVRIRSSQSRHISSIYEKSPIQSWVDLFNNVFLEDKYVDFRKYMIENFVAKNYIGLVQIKNYAKYKYLLRECAYLIKYRWKNIFNPMYWFYVSISILLPPMILIRVVDWYKNTIYTRYLKRVQIKHDF